jgi:hypothetical protein
MVQNIRGGATIPAADTNTEQGNLIWGAEAIGREINRTAAQVRYLFGIGFFRDAVWKAGHRTYVGDRQRLRGLANR